MFFLLFLLQNHLKLFDSQCDLDHSITFWECCNGSSEDPLCDGVKQTCVISPDIPFCQDACNVSEDFEWCDDIDDSFCINVDVDLFWDCCEEKPDDPFCNAMEYQCNIDEDNYVCQAACLTNQDYDWCSTSDTCDLVGSYESFWECCVNHPEIGLCEVFVQFCNFTGEYDICDSACDVSSDFEWCSESPEGECNISDYVSFWECCQINGGSDICQAAEDFCNVTFQFMPLCSEACEVSENYSWCVEYNTCLSADTNEEFWDCCHDAKEDGYFDLFCQSVEQACIITGISEVCIDACDSNYSSEYSWCTNLGRLCDPTVPEEFWECCLNNTDDIICSALKEGCNRVDYDDFCRAACNLSDDSNEEFEWCETTVCIIEDDLETFWKCCESNQDDIQCDAAGRICDLAVYSNSSDDFDFCFEACNISSNFSWCSTSGQCDIRDVDTFWKCCNKKEDDTSCIIAEETCKFLSGTSICQKACEDNIGNYIWCSSSYSPPFDSYSSSDGVSTPDDSEGLSLSLWVIIVIIVAAIVVIAIIIVVLKFLVCKNKDDDHYQTQSQPLNY